jgi:hypothetical protein
MSPLQAVAYSFEYFFGIKPSSDFLTFYTEQIERDHLNFIQTCLSQWPNRAIAERAGTRDDSMQSLRHIVSSSFLMAIPSDKFLNFAYSEFFGREVDPEGTLVYGKMDFTKASNRLKLMQVLAKSQEFAGTKREIAWSKDLVSTVAATENAKLCWNVGAVVPPDWFNATQGPGLFARFNPLLLWIPDRDVFYSVPGMTIKGKLAKNTLTAPAEWVFWGPKSPMAKGMYKLRCDIKTGEHDLMSLDVCSAAGGVVYRKIDFFGELKVDLPLELHDNVKDIEVRLFNAMGRNTDIKIQEVALSTM